MKISRKCCCLYSFANETSLRVSLVGSLIDFELNQFRLL